MTTRTQAGSKLAKALDAGRFAVLAECLPPRSADGHALRRAASALPQSLDAVVVPEGGPEVRACGLAAAALLVAAGHEPVLCLAGRDRNRIALCSDLLGAAALGVVDFVCRSGEHHTLGACPQAAGVFDVDSVQLLLGIAQMSEEASESRITPYVGAMAHPGLKPLELCLVDLRKKTQAGARFLLTDEIFDTSGFDEWMQAVRDAGIPEQCHVIASVKPLGNAEEAEELRGRQRGVSIPDDVIARLAQAEDPRQEGIAICAEIAQTVRRIDGVRGIHIAGGGCEEAAAKVIERASLQQR